MSKLEIINEVLEELSNNNQVTLYKYMPINNKRHAIHVLTDEYYKAVRLRISEKLNSLKHITQQRVEKKQKNIAYYLNNLVDLQKDFQRTHLCPIFKGQHEPWRVHNLGHAEVMAG